MYSYAIILWELLTKEIPFADLQSGGRLRKSMMAKMAQDNLRLKLPEGTPAPIRKLITSCWHPVPSKRPTTGHCLIALEKYAATAKDSDKKFLNKHNPIGGVEPFFKR